MTSGKHLFLHDFRIFCGSTSSTNRISQMFWEIAFPINLILGIQCFCCFWIEFLFSNHVGVLLNTCILLAQYLSKQATGFCCNCLIAMAATYYYMHPPTPFKGCECDVKCNPLWSIDGWKCKSWSRPELQKAWTKDDACPRCGRFADHYHSF